MAKRKRRRRKKSSAGTCVTVRVSGHSIRLKRSKRTGRFTGKCR